MPTLYHSSLYPHSLYRKPSRPRRRPRLRPGWAGRNAPHRPAARLPPGPTPAGARGGGDTRRPGQGCSERATRRRSPAGAQRRGCPSGVCRLREPRRTGRRWSRAMAVSLEAGTGSGAPRAMGRGNWCVVRAAAASSASCTPGRPPGGPRRRSPGVRPPTPRGSGAAPRRGPASAPLRSGPPSIPEPASPSARHRLLGRALPRPVPGPLFRGPALCLLSPWKPFRTIWPPMASSLAHSSGPNSSPHLPQTLDERVTEGGNAEHWGCQLLSVSLSLVHFLELQSFYSIYRASSATDWARRWGPEE